MSATLRITKFCLKLANATKRNLPFVIVRSVTIATAFLVLAANVDAKVRDDVVGLVAVPVVNTLPSLERATEVLCHGPAVFKNEWSARWTHRPEHRKFVRFKIGRTEHNVSAAGFVSAKSATLCPKKMPLADLHATARKAVAVVVFSLNKLPQMPERIPSLFLACWTGNTRAPSPVPAFVQAHHSVLSSNCWMWRKCRFVMRSCHEEVL